MKKSFKIAGLTVGVLFVIFFLIGIFAQEDTVAPVTEPVPAAAAPAPVEEVKPAPPAPAKEEPAVTKEDVKQDVSDATAALKVDPNVITGDERAYMETMGEYLGNMQLAMETLSGLMGADTSEMATAEWQDAFLNVAKVLIGAQTLIKAEEPPTRLVAIHNAISDGANSAVKGLEVIVDMIDTQDLSLMDSATEHFADVSDAMDRVSEETTAFTAGKK